MHCEDIGILGDISAAVTIGDAENIELLRRYGVRYIECDNQPLGRKHLLALDEAAKRGHSGFMVLPSDDLVSREWVDAAPSFEYGTPPSCALVDPFRRWAKVLKARPGGRMKFGACRVFSRAVVEAVGGLWSDGLNKSLDADSDGRIRASGYELKIANIRGPSFVDIKTPESLWGFDVWTGEGIAMDEVLWMCSPRVRVALSCLSRST